MQLCSKTRSKVDQNLRHDSRVLPADRLVEAASQTTRENSNFPDPRRRFPTRLSNFHPIQAMVFIHERIKQILQKNVLGGITSHANKCPDKSKHMEIKLRVFTEKSY
jgi:hypothetical protein